MTRDYEDDRDFAGEDDKAMDEQDDQPEGRHDDDEGEGEEGEGGEGGDDRGGGGRGRGRGDDRRRERIDSFEKMKVWQEAHQLTLKVFGVTPNLPAEQQAGLALQMEQAAVAVPKTSRKASSGAGRGTRRTSTTSPRRRWRRCATTSSCAAIWAMTSATTICLIGGTRSRGCLTG